MATLEQIQELSNRGLQDRLSPQKRAKFDEMVRRGLITSKTPAQPTTDQETQLPIGQLDGNGQISVEATEKPESGIVEQADRIITGGTEAALAFGSSIGAEILAGFGAIGKTGSEALLGDLDIFGEGAKSPETAEAGKRIVSTINQIREATTFKPRTEAGIQAVNAVGEFLQPIGEAFKAAESAIGNKVLQLTNSPALAALSEAIPTLGAELLGFGVAKGAIKAKGALKGKKAESDIIKELGEAVPTKEQLFDTSTAIYNELDNSGVTVKPDAFRKLTQKLNADARKKGLSKLTPDSQNMLGEFNKILDEVDATDAPVTLQDMDFLRKVTQSGSTTASRTDKAIAGRLTKSVDDFLDNAEANSLSVPKGESPQVTKKFKIAQDLWRRGRSSETIQEAITEAGKTASGFENGLRIEFRKILRKNSPVKRFFNAEEQTVMQKVIDGNKTANLARFLGKFSPFEGQSTRPLTSLVGAGAGGALAPDFGLVVMPAVGVISSTLARKMTLGRAKFADSVIRAGRNGRKIAKAYIDNVPRSQRSPSELSELLMKPDIDLANIPDTPLTRGAISIANINRGLVAGSAATVEGVQAQAENRQAQ